MNNINKTQKDKLEQIKNWVIIVAIVALVLFIVFIIKNNKNSSVASFDPTKECVSHGNLLVHSHVNLKIMINNKEQSLPGDIGFVNHACLRPFHTHKNDNILHLEYHKNIDFQLKGFFAVWGNVFNSQQILTYKIDDKHRIRVTVNEKESQDFENIILKDKDQVIIYYEEK